MLFHMFLLHYDAMHDEASFGLLGGLPGRLASTPCWKCISA